MAGFQNTKQKLKDAATADASSTLSAFHIVATKNAASGTIKAGEFVANGAAGAANVAALVGVSAKVTIGGANGGDQNYNQASAAVIAGHFILNYSNGVNVPANTAYGVVIDHDRDTGTTRAAAPTAFICFGEGSAASNPTKFLFEIGRTGKLVNATAVSGASVYSANSVDTATANGSIQIRVNGAAKHIPLFDTLSSNATNFNIT